VFTQYYHYQQNDENTNNFSSRSTQRIKNITTEVLSESGWIDNVKRPRESCGWADCPKFHCWPFDCRS